MSTSVRNSVFSGVTGRVRFGVQSVFLTKFALPKESIKTETIRYIGEMVAQAETVGIYEIPNFEVETTTAGFQIILARWQVHGNSIPEFPVMLTDRHPLVGTTAYSRKLVGCSFRGIEEAKANDEKADVVKLTLMAKEVWRKGTNGAWSSIAWHPSLGNAAANALIF